LHRRGVERVNCGPKLLDLGEKGVYSSYTLYVKLDLGDICRDAVKWRIRTFKTNIFTRNF